MPVKKNVSEEPPGNCSAAQPPVKRRQDTERHDNAIDVEAAAAEDDPSGAQPDPKRPRPSTSTGGDLDLSIAAPAPQRDATPLESPVGSEDADSEDANSEAADSEEERSYDSEGSRDPDDNHRPVTGGSLTRSDIESALSAYNDRNRTDVSQQVLRSNWQKPCTDCGADFGTGDVCYGPSRKPFEVSHKWCESCMASRLGGWLKDGYRSGEESNEEGDRSP